MANNLQPLAQLPTAGTMQTATPTPLMLKSPYTLPGGVVVNESSVTTAVRAVLFSLIRQPVHSLKVIEVYGRIAVVAYAPHGHYDPVLPVPIAALPPTFARLFAALSQQMTGWVQHYEQYGPELTPDWYAAWGTAVAELVGEMIDVVNQSGCLTRPEKSYFQMQLLACASEPQSVYRVWGTRPAYERPSVKYRYAMSPADVWWRGLGV